MRTVKLSLLGYLASLRASLDHVNDGNTVALVDRAVHSLDQIEGAKFDRHDDQPEAPQLTVTEGHIGAPGNEHLTEADIDKPLGPDNTVTTDALEPVDRVVVEGAVPPPLSGASDKLPPDQVPVAPSVPPAPPPMFTAPPSNP